MSAIDKLAQSLMGDKSPGLSRLVQLVHLILDDLTDMTIQAETSVHDQILHMPLTLPENPGTVLTSDLTKLRWQVDKLVSLIENQQYCKRTPP